MGKILLKYRVVTIFMLAALAFLPVFSVLARDGAPLKQAQDEKTELERQLAEIEKQIADYQKELGAIKGEKNTLQNKIKQLQKQQAAINLQIKSTNLQIAVLGNQLRDTKSAIDVNIAKSERLKEQMARYIRVIHENDNDPVLYALVSQNSLADALDEAEKYLQMSASLRGLLEETLQIKNELDKQAQTLAEQQEEAKDLLAIKVLQQQQLTGSMNEQNNLLTETKGKEANYQLVLSNTQKKAAEIRNRLYQLLGVSAQITFGQAAQIAQWASGLTGVRAAFLLAILTQESNLGKNVGTCNRPGDDPEKSWRAIMKPNRDHEPFLAITAELGMDPDVTPVSCPMRDSRGNRIGWGGAMGPAQFIPSTWMGYKEQVSAITGKMASPWDIRDAFIAAAVKLKAGGAGAKEGEWAAAMRYFSGSTNLRFRFYGDNVVALANQYQNDIDSMGGQ